MRQGYVATHNGEYCAPHNCAMQHFMGFFSIYARIGLQAPDYNTYQNEKTPLMRLQGDDHGPLGAIYRAVH